MEKNTFKTCGCTLLLLEVWKQISNVNKISKTYYKRQHIKSFKILSDYYKYVYLSLIWGSNNVLFAIKDMWNGFFPSGYPCVQVDSG